MQQTCSQCGFVSPVPAKFCRQCGAAFFAESESSEAATRQYGRQTPAPETPPTSHPFTSPTPQAPPSVADTFAPNTARLQNQPQTPYGQPQAPMGMPPAYPAYPPPAPKSNWWKWLLGFALTTLLVCGGLLGYAFKRAREAAPNVQQQIAEAIRKAQEEADRAARESGVPGGIPGGVPGGVPAPPPPPPPPLPPGQKLPQNIEQLRYPGATEQSNVEAFGQRVLKLTTSDAAETVKAYYEKQFGRAPIKSRERGREAVIFIQSPYMVTVGPDDENSGQTAITLIRSGFIPQIDKPEKFR